MTDDDMRSLLFGDYMNPDSVWQYGIYHNDPSFIRTPFTALNTVIQPLK